MGKFLDQLKEILTKKDNMLIVIRPDPDSMASAMALTKICKPLVKSVKTARIGQVKRMENRTMTHLLKIKMNDFDKIDYRKFSKFAVVDGQPGHFKGRDLPDFDIIIDHHPDENYTAPVSIVKPAYGANSTIMAELMEDSGTEIDSKTATALCYGIKTDTNNFERSGNKKDVLIFGNLFAAADPRILMNIQKWEIPRHVLSNFSYALKHITIKYKRLVHYAGKLNSSEDLVLLTDFLNSIEGVSLCVVCALIGDKLILIFRESGLTHNVGQIAQRSFGDVGNAGGHKSMARAEIPVKNLEFDPQNSNHRYVEEFIRRRLKK
ncbi:MAG: DHH family phosphoesterase [Fibrobacterota bacterium]